jgi:hypothetical protein
MPSNEIKNANSIMTRVILPERCMDIYTSVSDLDLRSIITGYFEINGGGEHIRSPVRVVARTVRVPLV